MATLGACFAAGNVDLFPSKSSHLPLLQQNMNTVFQQDVFEEKNLERVQVSVVPGLCNT